jgi:fatty-acyl-CoA synthase
MTMLDLSVEDLADRAKRGLRLEGEAGRRALAEARSRTVWQALGDSARAHPDHPFLVGANDAGAISRATFADILRRATGLSAGLASIGVRRGDRVAVWMTNTIEWVITMLATMRLGAVLVPVNTFLTPSEIKYFFVQSGARHLIMIDGFRKLNMPELLAEICPSATTTKDKGYLFDPELPDLRNIVIFGRSGHLDCAYDLEALIATDAPEALALADRMEREVTPGQLGMIKYTSGSTAFPKGVMLDQGGVVANAVLHSRRIGVRQDDVYFSMMPFFHAGGSIYGLLTMLVNGGTLVFTEAFNASLAAELTVSEQATISATILGEEIVQAGLDKGLTFPSLRIAEAPNETARKVMPNANTTWTAFGLTETHGSAAVTRCVDGANNANGQLLDGHEGRVVHPETGVEQPPGVPGELYVRGNLAHGYWNKPEETAKAFGADGWFRTEDLVSIDEAGYLTFHGRLKLMLKVGGENVSLEEVERVAQEHPAIFQCGAVGLLDSRKGEAIGLYVVTGSGHSLTEEELRSWMSARLARFKIPREIVFLDLLPRLGNGKLNRIELNRRAKAEFGS